MDRVDGRANASPSPAFAHLLPGTFLQVSARATRHAAKTRSPGGGLRVCQLSRFATKSSRSPIRTFEDWVVRAFGRRLYEIFFRSYTEKVGACLFRNQRRVGGTANRRVVAGVNHASVLPGRRRNGAVIKTVIDRFRYPPHGPGEVWERVAALIQKEGGGIRMANASSASRVPRDALPQSGPRPREWVAQSRRGSLYIDDAAGESGMASIRQLPMR